MTRSENAATATPDNADTAESESVTAPRGGHEVDGQTHELAQDKDLGTAPHAGTIPPNNSGSAGLLIPPPDPIGRPGHHPTQTRTATVRSRSRRPSLTLIAAVVMIIAAVGVVLIRAQALDLPGATAGAATDTASATSNWCAKAKALGDLNGKTVTVLSVFTGASDQYEAAYRVFTECTGATVNYTPAQNLGVELLAGIQSGKPPDVAVLSRPSLLQIVNDTGKVTQLPADVEAFAEQYFPGDWMAYGRLNGTQYALPNNVDFKSLVWYSAKTFKAKGYQIPTTWEELQNLQNQIANSGTKPWCIGARSGGSTGWTITDWVEDYVLRSAGPDVYDRWIAHDVKFTDPRIADALKQVGDVLKNPQTVNAGFGDIPSITSTGIRDPAGKVISGDCSLWKFNSGFFPANTVFGPDGDIDAFYYPPITDQFGQVALGSGTFYAAFADRPEVHAFMLFTASPEFANARAHQGNFISANRELKSQNVSNPVLKTALAKLQQDTTVFRLDASELMPVQVGSSAELEQLTAWIAGQDDATTLSNIDAAWPR